MMKTMMKFVIALLLAHWVWSFFDHTPAPQTAPNPPQPSDVVGAKGAIPDDGSQQISEQGYKMYPDIWAIHRMDGTIYQSDYGSIGRVLATESGSKFNISINLQGVRGYILRNGGQYDFYSAAGDRIGRILPCRWDGNGNGWDIFTTIQGYIGHIDRQGDWILRLGCSLMVDLNTLHDYYIKNTKKFELPETFLAGGDGLPHPVGEASTSKGDNYVGTTAGTSQEDVAKELAKNEVIRVMNGGHLPANLICLRKSGQDIG
jgi:hypothetical protein